MGLAETRTADTRPRNDALTPARRHATTGGALGRERQGRWPRHVVILYTQRGRSRVRLRGGGMPPRPCTSKKGRPAGGSPAREPANGVAHGKSGAAAPPPATASTAGPVVGHAQAQTHRRSTSSVNAAPALERPAVCTGNDTGERSRAAGTSSQDARHGRRTTTLHSTKAIVKRTLSSKDGFHCGTCHETPARDVWCRETPRDIFRVISPEIWAAASGISLLCSPPCSSPAERGSQLALLGGPPLP